MFKVLILQAMHALSDERTEFLIKDRLSFMRFLGSGLADNPPDANRSKPTVDLAIPAFGYKNHVSIDRGFGLIRKWTTTPAAWHDGSRLEDV